MNEIWAFAGFLVACFAAASMGALFKPGPWYEMLDHPPWRPPNWLFPPAWTLLFLLIAASAWLVWRQAGLAGAAVPLGVWAASLVVNAAWSPIFFGLRRPDWAMAELVLLWLSIVATIVLFAPISQLAAWLLAPYLAWVTFAGALNWSIARRNPRGYPGGAVRLA